MKIKQAAPKVRNYQKINDEATELKKLLKTLESIDVASFGDTPVDMSAISGSLWAAMLSGAKEYLENLETNAERLGEEEIK